MEFMNTEETQKVLKWFRISLIVLTIFLVAEALGALKDLRGIDPAYNSISVSGKGEVISVPDIATFSFTVSADAKVASDAQNLVTEKMDAILLGLKSLGVEEKDIKTTDYSLFPKYTYEQIVCSSNYCPPGRQVQDGFTVSHNVSVKVRKTEDAGKVLALAGEKGATSLSGISFTVDDPEKIFDEAQAKAIADAKNKAKALSRELGVRLVRVVSFYDNTGGGPGPYYAEGVAMGGDVARGSIPAPTLPTGENKTIVNVTVVYEIR